MKFSFGYLRTVAFFNWYLVLPSSALVPNVMDTSLWVHASLRYWFFSRSLWKMLLDRQYFYARLALSELYALLHLYRSSTSIWWHCTLLMMLDHFWFIFRLLGPVIRDADDKLMQLHWGDEPSKFSWLRCRVMEYPLWWTLWLCASVQPCNSSGIYPFVLTGPIEIVNDVIWAGKLVFCEFYFLEGIIKEDIQWASPSPTNPINEDTRSVLTCRQEESSGIGHCGSWPPGQHLL